MFTGDIGESRMFKYTAEIVLGPSFEFKHAQNPTSGGLHGER